MPPQALRRQPWDTPADRALVLASGRARPDPAVAGLAVGAGTGRAGGGCGGGAAGDLRAAGAHLGGLRLAWLGVVVAAQGVALAGGTAAQRQLLAAGGASLRWLPVRAGRLLSVPSRGLLFAYAAGQLAGRLVPLPGGIGGVEGGMLGALTLTGTASVAAAAAVIVYRVAGCWAVGAAGTRGGSRPRPPLPRAARGGTRPGDQPDGPPP